MSVFVVLTGTVYRVSDRRVSKTGNPYVVVTVKTSTQPAWWKVITWDENIIAAMSSLREGELVVVQGQFFTLGEDRRCAVQATVIDRASNLANGHEKLSRRQRKRQRQREQKERRQAVPRLTPPTTTPVDARMSRRRRSVEHAHASHSNELSAAVRTTALV